MASDDEILISDLLCGELVSCEAKWEWTTECPPGAKDEISMLSVDICATFKTLSSQITEAHYGQFAWQLHSPSDHTARDHLLSSLAAAYVAPHLGAEFAVREIFGVWGQMIPNVPTHGWVSCMDVQLEFLVNELPYEIYNYYHGEYEIPDDEEGWDVRFVAASKEAIEGLERMRVSEEADEESCAVCLEDILVGSEATQLPCWHFFHGDCIVQWLNTSKFCPLCRFELPSL